MSESKQVKVDNWGIFFLQRLQTFFNKTFFCDLTLQFEDNVQLKVHRLVLNACTEYFQILEQTCDTINHCLIMPPDLQADVVVPIVNFMYTGILEFQTSIFDRLYSTARLMNMTVLTKLLDAQKVPISPLSKPINKRSPITPITWNLQGKKISPKTMDPDLPEQLPGRKLPIWKRKSVPVSNLSSYSTGTLQTVPDPLSTKYFRSHQDETPKPTRFEWPEDDENFETNSFDEISYTSKPITLPVREKSPKPSTSNFDEVKRSSVKRPASPIYNDNKRVNIQEVKEYMKEQKLRSDYNDYDDSEAADNDLQTFDDNNDSEDDNNQSTEETKSILKNDSTPPHNKRVRFSLEGKENSKTTGNHSIATIKTNASDVTNHTKIITEVLKKFPQLVQKNKNIRLKILSKGQNSSSGLKPIGTPTKVVKPLSKISYMVTKPPDTSTKATNQDKKDGHWSCQKCCDPNPLQFETYHSFRQHLTETHNEKTDSQMCNICGHISRKQNMLMYHKYVKHNIEPPPIFQFPKCNKCPYIALSPSLLIKHQYNHTHQNLVCAECSTAFANKTDLIRHIQTTGHTGDNYKQPPKTFNCNFCTKKFISADTLYQHIRNNHKDEATVENNENEEDRRGNIITAEEIDALEEQDTIPQETQQIVQDIVEPLQPVVDRKEVKPKEKKIKIISDIKVNTPISTNRLLPMNKEITITENDEKAAPVEIESQQLEPSSEAESLSNVASGIAASLGLVNTIVVLDENNQFILQDRSQTAGNQQNFILPDGTNIENLHVTQHQVINTDNNSIITQAQLNKNNIDSTDELVMVLTDHDYSDAENSAVLTSENSNIVVLYSHPVQGHDAEFMSQQANLMLNSNMGLVEVSNNYSVNNKTHIEEKQCEESIEMIQQEINNHLETEIPVHIEKSIENDKPQTEIIQENVASEEQEVPVSVINTPEENPDSPEKMDIDPFESTELTKEESDILNRPIPSVLDQNKSDIETISPENISDIQHQDIQDQVHTSNKTEIQNISNETVLEIENITEVSETQNISETMPEDKLEIQTPAITAVQEKNAEVQFEEPMEIEESVEMIQQEIDNNAPRHEVAVPIEISSNTGVLESTVDIPVANNFKIVEVKELTDISSSADVTECTVAIPVANSFNILEQDSDTENRTDKLATIIEEAEPSEIKESKEHQQQENEELNIRKEIEKTAEITEENKQEEYIEHMEIDSSKDTCNNKNENKTEENISESFSFNENEENFAGNISEEITNAECTTEVNIQTANAQENCESTEAENIEPLTEDRNITEQIVQLNGNELLDNSSENEELQNTQSIDVVDSGIDVNTNLLSTDSDQQSQTCAEMSQLSETESLTETVDEVSDIPPDSTDNPSIHFSESPQRNAIENISDMQQSYSENNLTQEQITSEIFEQPSHTLEKQNSELKNTLQETTEKDSESELASDVISKLEDKDSDKDLQDKIPDAAIETDKSVELQETEICLEKEKQNEKSCIENENLIKETNQFKSNNISKIVNKNSELSSLTSAKISNLLDDWDDGDTDSQQSDTPKQIIPPQKEVIDNRSSINTLINDWEDEDD